MSEMSSLNHHHHLASTVSTRDSLPPSPPNTNSSKHSPEAEASENVPSVARLEQNSMDDATPPLSPPNTAGATPSDSVKSGSPPASPGMSPLPPFPNEIFLLIMQHLSQGERADMCLVSRHWANFLHNEPSLWSELRVSLEDPDTEILDTWIRRASVGSNKRGGGIVHLSIILSAVQTRTHFIPVNNQISDSEYLSRLNQLISLVGSASTTEAIAPDGTKYSQSTLKTFRLHLHPNTLLTAQLAHNVSQLMPSRTLRQLEEVEMYLGMAMLPVSLEIFASWPSLRRFTVACPRESDRQPRARLNEWSLHRPRNPQLLTSPNLEVISIRGAFVSDHFGPAAFPALTSITLSEVDWKGYSFYLLLKAARSTLVHLELRDTTFIDLSEPHMTDEYQECIELEEPELEAEFEAVKAQGFFTNLGTLRREVADEQDPEDPIPADPTPIVMASLRTLILTGELTPPIFSSMDQYETVADDVPFPTPILLMPNLETAQLTGLALDSYENFVEEGRGALFALGMCAPNVQKLIITDCDVDEASLFHCLMATSHTIRALILHKTSVSDQLVANLARLTPGLQEIDVRRCREISIQGVARLAEVIREQSLGSCKLTSVRIDAPHSLSTHEYAAYQWLDFVGVLARDDQDFESLGPPRDSQEFIQWKRNGKRDIDWQAKEQVRIEDERKRAEFERHEASLRHYRSHLFASESSGGSSFKTVSTHQVPTTWHRSDLPLMGTHHTPGAGQPRGLSLGELSAIQQHQYQLQQPHYPGPATARVGINLGGVPIGTTSPFIASHVPVDPRIQAAYVDPSRRANVYAASRNAVSTPTINALLGRGAELGNRMPQDSAGEGEDALSDDEDLSGPSGLEDDDSDDDLYK